ncbi:unnamed protein product [Sphenostylis stenocarpa]|uniref:Uncharacterized protein n=1 Tax=Sphenostylis stenocarpa TaxID=92480 RepID=A0AA86SWQ7_9FABA|nr:unnamed protein product [Sphenostylis stenocarpa]
MATGNGVMADTNLLFANGKMEIFGWVTLVKFMVVARRTKQDLIGLFWREKGYEQEDKKAHIYAWYVFCCGASTVSSQQELGGEASIVASLVYSRLTFILN